MPDIATVWNQTNGDWAMAGADLLGGNDLATAVIISLFTDAQAAPDDAIPDGSTDPRGWWGDLGATKPVGSKWWLRYRSKATQQTLALVKSDAEAALKWLVDDGVAAKVTVVPQWQAPGFLATLIQIQRRDGSTIALNFPSVWAPVS